MPNDLLIQPETEPLAVQAPASGGAVLDASFGMPLQDTPIWTGLYENIRDAFFSPKLPPLELTSTPIPVPDRMAVPRNPWAAGAAALLNGTILVLLLFFGVKTIIQGKAPSTVTAIDIPPYTAPKALAAPGGGGGAPDKAPAIKGKIPPRMTAPEAAPKIMQPPTPTVNVQQDIALPKDPNMPNFGMNNSVNVKLQSLGSGSGVGLGSGNGSGYGSGTGGNIGGGYYQVGGVITAPSFLHTVDPEFTDQARRAKYQGVCIVSVYVDAHGNPHNPHVVRALGMGLDEKAIEAIMQYKFRPGTRYGNPVAVGPVDVEIDFRIY